MESRTFDDVARTVGRRGLLAGLLAVAATGARWRGGAAEDVPECPDGCAADEICVDGYCQRFCSQDADCQVAGDACTGGQCIEGSCTFYIVDCVPGYSCCGNGECCPNPCTTDEECTSPLLCTTGFCGEAGVCEFVEQESCVICETEADCGGVAGGATCCGGTCVAACPGGSVLGEDCVCQPVGALGPAGGPLWPPVHLPPPGVPSDWPLPVWPPRQ